MFDIEIQENQLKYEDFVQDCIDKCVAKAFDSFVPSSCRHVVDFKEMFHSFLIDLVNHFEILNRAKEIDDETTACIIGAADEMMSVDIEDILREYRISCINEDGVVINPAQQNLFEVMSDER